MTRTDDKIFNLPEGIVAAVVHPGRTVAAELAARGLSAHRAARNMRVSPNRLTLIINGHRGVSADTALRLARLFGNSARFWINLQSQYDLALVQRDHGKRIMAEVQAA